MPSRVFVSYCHSQGPWVLDRLVPVLRAGGAEVLIDRERFEAGRGVRGQMDATQDGAEIDVLILSPDYWRASTASTRWNGPSPTIHSSKKASSSL